MWFTKSLVKVKKGYLHVIGVVAIVVLSDGLKFCLKNNSSSIIETNILSSSVTI